MEYNKIIAVTGLPGLYELLSSKADGAIVRSLDDKTTRFVSSRIHNFSHLESIEVYTVRDNVNLADILKAMEASAEQLPDEKDNSSLKSYFSKVYPDLDFDRVYSSDLKKMVKWFAVLKSNDIEITFPEPEEDGEETEKSAPEEETAKEKEEKDVKPAAKAVKKEEKPVKPAKPPVKEEKPKAEAAVEKTKEAGKAKEKKAEVKNTGEKKPGPKKKADTGKKEPASKKSQPAPKKKK
jgi:hypothetical protein